jgi:hypothetical protein
MLLSTWQPTTIEKPFFLISNRFWVDPTFRLFIQKNNANPVESGLNPVRNLISSWPQLSTSSLGITTSRFAKAPSPFSPGKVWPKAAWGIALQDLSGGWLSHLPLWKMMEWVRQLGWWHSHMGSHNPVMFQTTNQFWWGLGLNKW